MSNLALRITCPGDNGFALQLACELPARGITAIYGASGSGKSTLLDCIAGLRNPAPESVIQFGDETWLQPGRNIPPWQRHIGYVFQDARLFPHLTVAQNLQFALRRRANSLGPELDQVVAWLELTELLSRSPQSLSAGEKQRVAIGRALLSAPRLLLLDEPLANLDHSARQHCLRCLLRLTKELELPMLYVSHDIEEVSQLADYLVLLEAGQLADHGSLLTLCSRMDTRLSQEEQAAAILMATIAQHDDVYGLTELDIEGRTLFVNHLPQQPGRSCRVRIPARDVSLCKQQPTDTSILNILPITVSEIEDAATPRLLLRLQLGSQFLLARITRKSAVDLDIKVGDELYAQIKSAALLMEIADQT